VPKNLDLYTLTAEEIWEFMQNDQSISGGSTRCSLSLFLSLFSSFSSLFLSLSLTFSLSLTLSLSLFSLSLSLSLWLFLFPSYRNLHVDTLTCRFLMDGEKLAIFGEQSYFCDNICFDQHDTQFKREGQAFVSLFAFLYTMYVVYIPCTWFIYDSFCL
jgi:hypothetical protein